MLRSLLEIAGVVLFRFPWHLRVWAILVAAVNLASVAFLDVLEGQVVILAILVALLIMAVIYKRLGYVRLLGLGHITWFAMLPWLFFRLPSAESNPVLYGWLVTLLVVNSICLVVDSVDVTRFALGDRKPHYGLRPISKDAEGSRDDGSTG